MMDVQRLNECLNGIQSAVSQLSVPSMDLLPLDDASADGDGGGIAVSLTPALCHSFAQTFSLQSAVASQLLVANIFKLQTLVESLSVNSALQTASATSDSAASIAQRTRTHRRRRRQLQHDIDDVKRRIQEHIGATQTLTST